MKISARTQQIFHQAGHDVQTVREESLQGAPDEEIYTVCCTEQRCLVTLDLDFSNVKRFPPDQTGGIVVIRVPHNPSLTLLENLVQQFLRSTQQLPITKRLWIVEPGRIRVHQTDVGDDL